MSSTNSRAMRRRSGAVCMIATVRSKVDRYAGRERAGRPGGWDDAVLTTQVEHGRGPQPAVEVVVQRHLRQLADQVGGDGHRGRIRPRTMPDEPVSTACC